MKELFPLHGIVTVLNTPFTEADKIDFHALEGNIIEALDAGVVGFLVPAMASEVQSLTVGERLAMLKCVMQTTDGKVPVFAGTASSSFDEAMDVLLAYLDLGCKNVLIQLPLLNEKQFKEDFLGLADCGPEVIMLQDWDAAGYGLPDHLIMDLFETVPSFRCLKVETKAAGSKYSHMLKLSNGKLHVSGGWAVNQMLEGLLRGVHAFMPTGMHWIYAKIFREFHKGNIQEATALFNEILPVLAFSNQYLDISIHFFKRLLWKQGIYPTPEVRQTLLPFDDIHMGLADNLIQYVMEIENRIKSEKSSAKTF
jgi:dihydrodipicolinate synthase/N-acetylneuraminate lyase